MSLSMSMENIPLISMLFIRPLVQSSELIRDIVSSRSDGKKTKQFRCKIRLNQLPGRRVQKTFPGLHVGWVVCLTHHYFASIRADEFEMPCVSSINIPDCRPILMGPRNN